MPKKPVGPNNDEKIKRTDSITITKTGDIQIFFYVSGGIMLFMAGLYHYISLRERTE